MQCTILLDQVSCGEHSGYHYRAASRSECPLPGALFCNGQCQWLPDNGDNGECVPYAGKDFLLKRRVEIPEPANRFAGSYICNSFLPSLICRNETTKIF